MNLFLVLYTGAGLIVGVAGPLPYRVDECHRRADAINDAATRQPEIAKGLHAECEFHTERPVMRTK